MRIRKRRPFLRQTQSHARVDGAAHRVEAGRPYTEHSLSSLAYTFSAAVHVALPKQSQLLPPLCSKPSQASPLTQFSQGAASLRSSGHLPLRSPLLPATFSLTVFPPEQPSCYSPNIPDPFLSQGLYSYCLFPQAAKVRLQYPSDWLSHLPQVSG